MPDGAPAVLIAGEDIRERTDALDAAGNTTAAIGKGFAIGSAALVSLALFGAYVTRSKIDLIESSILDPKVGTWLKFHCELQPGACCDRQKCSPCCLIPGFVAAPGPCSVCKAVCTVQAAAESSSVSCRCLLACWLVPCFPSGSVP